MCNIAATGREMDIIRMLLLFIHSFLNDDDGDDAEDDDDHGCSIIMSQKTSFLTILPCI